MSPSPPPVDPVPQIYLENMDAYIYCYLLLLFFYSNDFNYVFLCAFMLEDLSVRLLRVPLEFGLVGSSFSVVRMCIIVKQRLMFCRHLRVL